MFYGSPLRSSVGTFADGGGAFAFDEDASAQSDLIRNETDNLSSEERAASTSFLKFYLLMVPSLFS
jgi:hypothetical protein